MEMFPEKTAEGWMLNLYLYAINRLKEILLIMRATINTVRAIIVVKAIVPQRNSKCRSIKYGV